MKDKPKIALLKQEVYQDLYVCPVTEKDPEAILLSSMGRVGPIGLMAELDADFYITSNPQLSSSASFLRLNVLSSLN